MCNKLWCSVFGKGAQAFDFTRRHEIRKLADNVKYISQTKTIQHCIPSIKIKKSDKSKVKTPANWLVKSILRS